VYVALFGSSASVGEEKNFDNIKMHGMYVEKKENP
jgi:hypothetical protein